MIVLRLDLVDELADQVEDAVPGPDPLPQVIGREAWAGRRYRRISRTAEAPLVEGQKPSRESGEQGRHEDQFRVHGEVGEAAPVGKERLPRIAVVLILPDRILDVLPVERVLELGREDRDAVQEEREVETLLTLLAEAELAHDGEEVGCVEALQLLVEATRRPEICQPELAA